MSMKQKTSNMVNFFNFEIKEDHILDKGLKHYFFRFIPPNTSIMTDDEFILEISNLQNLMDKLNCSFQIFVCDKTENLSKNKNFFKTFKEEYDYLTSDILSTIENNEISSKSIQRSYYFVFKIKDEQEYITINNTLLSKGISYKLIEKEELITLHRNFLLREFNHINFSYFENDISNKFETLKEKQKKKTTKEEYFNEDLTKRITPISMKFNTYNIIQNGFLRKVIMIKNIPSKDILGYFKEISKYKNTTFSMRVTPLVDHEIARLLNTQINNNKIINKNKATDELESGKNIDDLKDFYTSLLKDNNKVFYMSIYIEIYGEDKEDLKRNLTNIKSNLFALGVTFDELPDEQKEGFLSVSPLGKDYFISCANNLPSNTLASMYPFSFSAKTDENGLFLGETIDGGNVFVDPYLRNNNTPNGNIAIFGTSGYGKTYLQKKILSQLIMSGCKTYTLDAEDEYAEMYTKLNGTVINCTSDKFKINVFEVRQIKGSEDDFNDDDELDVNNKAVYFQHLSWLKDFFTVLFRNITDKELSALMLYVDETYRFKNIDKNTDCKNLKETDYPIFTDLYNVIRADVDKKQKQFDIIDQKTSKDLLLMIADCHNGSLGYLLNGHTKIKDSNNICFCIRDLLSSSNDRVQATLFNIMTYIWNKITLKESRIVFDIDELHIYFEDKNMIVGKYIKNFIKRVRKYGSIIITSTQNFSDVTRDDILHITMGIFNNSAIKFVFFPGEADVKQAVKCLDLTDGEENLLNRQDRHHCLLKVGSEKYYVKVGTLPYEENLFGKASVG